MNTIEAYVIHAEFYSEPNGKPTWTRQFLTDNRTWADNKAMSARFLSVESAKRFAEDMPFPVEIGPFHEPRLSVVHR